MKANKYINLLNCMARFIRYGKHNILSIYEWEQNHLFKQTGKQATHLKSYKKWNEVENKIVSGKGVDLDIADCDEKIKFYDISQTSLPKHERKPKETADTIPTEQLAEFPSKDITEIGFSHKHRGLLLTALWMELSKFQKEYEKTNNSSKEQLLSHISAIYTVHSHYKSNWQDEKEVEAVFKNYTVTVNTSAENNLLGAFYSQLCQTVTNLIIMIEQQFYILVNNSDNNDDNENYFMKIRFYEICEKEKIAICRLRPNVTVDANLSIDHFEMMETLPYKPDMERTEFLEYLQSIYNNGLNLEHLALVRRKDKNGITVVNTYKVDVADWGYKQDYIDFEVVTSEYPIKYYLRPIAQEVLDSGTNGGNEIEDKPKPPEPPQIPKVKKQPPKPITPQTAEDKSQTQELFEPKTTVKNESMSQTAKTSKPEPLHKTATTAVDTANSSEDKQADSSVSAESIKTEKITEAANQVKGKSSEKKPKRKQRTDVLDKVNKLKEDIKNKTF